MHYPVIAFKDPDGVAHEVRANVGRVGTPGYRIGEPVPVLFARGHPEAVRIVFFVSPYWNPMCLLGIAAGGRRSWRSGLAYLLR